MGHRIRFTVQTVTAMRTALATLRDQLAEFVNAAGLAPATESPASRDILDYARPESVQTAHSQGVVLVEVAADHVTALLKTLTEPVETIAPWTCTRSLLEAAALACWILDPRIDVHTRVGRSLALRYEGLDQQAKWARASEQDPARCYGRIDAVERLAAELGFARVTDRKGRRIGIGQRMPVATDLIRDNLDEEALYRILSAIAHGHHWAIQQASFEITSPPAPDPASGVRVARLEKAPLMSGFAYLLMSASIVFAKTSWYQAIYFGWDLHSLAKLFEGCFDELGATAAVRFWRAT